MTRLAILFVLAGVSCAAPAAAPTSGSASATAITAQSSSPSATATAPATATPFASRSVIDPTRYGYVTVSPGRIVVRAERSTDPVLSIGGEQPAVSPDGKRIAFWRTGPQGNSPQELRVVEVPGGAERNLYSLAPGYAGGMIVWSNDGNGLLYEVHSSEVLGGVGAGPKSSVMESFDLAATQAPGETTSELALANGSVFVPLGWDKAGQLSFALITGEGGFAVEYVTWDRRVQSGSASGVKRTRFPWPVVANAVEASRDANLVLAIDAATNVLRIWPAADITANDQVSPGSAHIMDARWRPAPAHDVAWVLDRNVGVFSYQTSSVGTIYRGQAEVRILAWRVDGSGVVLNQQGTGVFVVDLASQEPAVTPLPHLGAVLHGGVLLR